MLTYLITVVSFCLAGWVGLLMAAAGDVGTPILVGLTAVGLLGAMNLHEGDKQ